MSSSAGQHRPLRLLAGLAGGSSLVLAFAAAAPSSAGALAATNAAARAGAATSGGIWGKAEQVPGLAALNTNRFATVLSMSCARAGDCSAGGDYADSSGGQGFVVDEIKGVWGKAEQVPGLATLNTGGAAFIISVSCARPGDCSAGGEYEASPVSSQAFVVGETGGVWGKAEQVPGLAALNTAGGAEVLSVSCARPGDCSAGGDYSVPSRSGFRTQAFVVSETGGVWGKAEQVPGTAALNTGGEAEVSSVSCAGPGDCGAGGYFFNNSSGTQGFVVSETGGVWGKAEQVPGTAALNTGGNAEVTSVSCARPGDCGAGGYYTGTAGFQAFVVSETGGVWGKAEEILNSAPPHQSGFINAMSCARPGDCSAVDGLTVVGEAKGVWGKAEPIPGFAALNTGGDAEVNSVSCARPGECSAGGFYEDSSFQQQGFVVSETGGVWGKAEEVPGTAGEEANVISVSCARPGGCSAGGNLFNSSGQQGFVVNRN
jgi:hypothetical protein